ncbi:hypothetical protein LCGC14_1854390 [marine sediment metagenome]|uniref:Uncharacterized protein n=1 Tax=marine sediment metagenome TaxID=412755 RepID=A0A0F9J8L9_9ZZZZ
MRLLRKILCWLGWHEWDGPIQHFPAPKCRWCREWHPNRKMDMELKANYPQHFNPDGTVKKMEW